jgi:hypothetical protein
MVQHLLRTEGAAATVDQVTSRLRDLTVAMVRPAALMLHPGMPALHVARAQVTSPLLLLHLFHLHFQGLTSRHTRLSCPASQSLPDGTAALSFATFVLNVETGKLRGTSRLFRASPAVFRARTASFGATGVMPPPLPPGAYSSGGGAHGSSSSSFSRRATLLPGL